jgi:LysM repeat protein
MSFLPSNVDQKIRIAAGDSLYKLASENLNDLTLWRELAQHNNLNIFQNLPIGDYLKIPTEADLEALATTQIKAISDSIYADLDLSSVTAAVNTITQGSLADWIL